MLPSSRRLENGLAGCTSRCLQVDNPGAYQHLWQVPRLRHGANLLEEELLRFYDEQSERILEEFLRNLWWNSKSGLTGPRHPRHFFTCLAASSLSKKIVGLMNHCLVEYQQCFRCLLGCHQNLEVHPCSGLTPVVRYEVTQGWFVLCLGSSSAVFVSLD